MSTAQPKHLVRGIDAIPANVRAASGLVALRGLTRSRTSLERLARTAEQAGEFATARELRRIRTACVDALECIQGGYDLQRLQPVLEQLSAAQATR